MVYVKAPAALRAVVSTFLAILMHERVTKLQALMCAYAKHLHTHCCARKLSTFLSLENAYPQGLFLLQNVVGDGVARSCKGLR